MSVVIDTRTKLRDAILTSIPPDPAQYAEPEPRYLYLPRSHTRALDPDNMLVVGMRGAGKSFWWHALQNEELRLITAEALGTRGFGTKLRVSAGWSNVEREEYPGRDELHKLLRLRYNPRIIWKAIIAVQVTDVAEVQSGDWADRVAWVQENPGEIANAFRAANDRLVKRKEKHLVLFDALDRTGDTWDVINVLLRGLLENLLDLRSSPAIRAKAFVRQDMLDDPSVQAFPDASKVIASRVSLEWPKTDLYGLLWQYLGNAGSGKSVFRKLAEAAGRRADSDVHGIWQMPDPIRNDEKIQRRLFEVVAGPYMGSDRRRGITYDWLPNHLADVHGTVSPRSFLAAIRAAANFPPPPEHRYTLHWNAIKSGVSSASEYRVIELMEDFPWVRPLMEPLEGLTIPCNSEEIVQHWKREGVLDVIRRLKDPRRPPRIERGYSGLIVDLEEMGVFDDIGDGRMNMPDVYRIGFLLRRKGGIRPVS